MKIAIVGTFTLKTPWWVAMCFADTHKKWRGIPRHNRIFAEIDRVEHDLQEHLIHPDRVTSKTEWPDDAPVPEGW